MIEVLLPPISDAGPNQGVPVGAAPHYACVDEDPNNGDTDYLQHSSDGDEAFGISVADLSDDDTIDSIIVRWAAKKGASDPFGAAGFRIGGVLYLGPFRELAGYAPVFEESFPTNPATGTQWLKAAVAAAQLYYRVVDVDVGNFPRPRVSQCVGLAMVTPASGRPRARFGSGSPVGTAGPAAGGATARSAGTAPHGIPRSGSPRSAIASSAPTATTRSTSLAARPGSATPRAITVADLPTLRVRFGSGAPRATIASSAPRGSVAARSPHAEGD